MVLRYTNSLGFDMGAPRKCLLCSCNFSPTGVRARFCPTCNILALKVAKSWHSMRSRVTPYFKQLHPCYEHVDICSEWAGKDSLPFIKWSLATGWQEGLVVDRRDGNKGYSPDNCRYVTCQVNCKNLRNPATDWVNNTRRCYSCKETKKFTDFYSDPLESGGITYICKVCSNAKRWKKHKPA